MLPDLDPYFLLASDPNNLENTDPIPRAKNRTDPQQWMFYFFCSVGLLPSQFLLPGMLLISDGNLDPVAHARRKIVFF